MRGVAFGLCVGIVMSADPLGSFLNLKAEDTFAAVRQKELEKIEQDPCAGCADPQVVSYQKCAASLAYNPCSTQYTGVAFDNSCCVVKQKHGMCLGCKGMGARPHYNSKWTDQLNSGTTVFEP